MKRHIKSLVSNLLSRLLRCTASLREGLERIYAHAHLAANLREPLPDSVVVLGKVSIHGTGRIHIGENVLLYPDVHLETRETPRSSLAMASLFRAARTS